MEKLPCMRKSEIATLQRIIIKTELTLWIYSRIFSLEKYVLMSFESIMLFCLFEILNPYITYLRVFLSTNNLMVVKVVK